MRKIQKDSIIELVNLLEEAQEHMGRLLSQQEYASVLDLLQQSQQAAIQIGTIIEQSEGEGTKTVTLLEQYCEFVFQMFEGVQKEEQTGEIKSAMDELLNKIENSIRTDIQVRKEVVFLPYKASMWDSLESIWMAADADPECDAYVVPIPYFEKDAEGNLKVYHYEGDDFPDYVPVVNYKEYPLEEICPDVVYIHNPYDHANYVTSVHPRFYSYELKKYTKCLVYVPYYSTAGGLSEGQGLCSAYLHADYIVVQAEKYIKFIDPSIPREKILPLGSPKFDRVLRLCQNPPQPPKAWKDKMEGKKVYFYNTSIGGMLADTQKFLLKMEYVFKCFAGREDACLLWRPHPLLESTFDSMRPQYRPVYNHLKKYFLQNNLGIYDDTPDMEKTIALCDAYVGDSGTSVTSLFGLAGKPMFILNNNIHSIPEEDDWRGEIVKGFYINGHDRWRVTQGNKLYYSSKDDYHYEFYCDLNEYSKGDYYLRAMEIEGKIVVCPRSAQDILIVEDYKVIKRIFLERKIERPAAFEYVLQAGQYLFLIPNQYPDIVRYDVRNDKVDYLEGIRDTIVRDVNGIKRVGQGNIWGDYVLIAVPGENLFLAIEHRSMKVQYLRAGDNSKADFARVLSEKDGVWLLPYEGLKVIFWNPYTGESREYTEFPKGFKCYHKTLGYECLLYPFMTVACYNNKVIFSPWWGNMFVSLDPKSGKAEKWDAPFDIKECKNTYFDSGSVGYFLREINDATYRFYCEPEREMYDVNLRTKEKTLLPIVFEKEEIFKNVHGFYEDSEWLQYACTEDAFLTLREFLGGRLLGEKHDPERQKRAYTKIAANGDGTAGEKIYQYTAKR